ncbi:Kynurenine formamidase [Trichostrongylus colubriformis]|uniref:Kynurenine formamidase n=1 Tax=Trichostrongylus colubriformis TaxID=6319 RepID=A0AAN8IAJ8_TRICO
MDPDPELTHLYSCSRWAGRDPNEVLAEYVRIGDETCKELRLLPHIEDLPYDDQHDSGNSDLAKVDIWGEVKDRLVILIHGGFWQEGNRKIISPAATNLVKRNIAVASVGYDYASSTHPISEVVRQVATAVNFLLNKYPQAKSVTLAGHSAGAHLAFKVYAQLRSPRIQKLVLFAGVYNLEDLPNCEIGSLIGLTPEEALKNRCNASELLGTNVQLLMLVAIKDSPKIIEQNRAMANALKDQGVTVEYQEFSNCDHFNLIHGLRYANEDHTRHFLTFI